MILVNLFIDICQQRRLLWRTFIAALAIVCCAPAAQAESASQVIDRVWEHLGGRESFQRVRYIQFDWVVENEGKTGPPRSHLWDRVTGDYVLKRQKRDTQEKVAVYFNIHSKTGSAFVNNVLLEGDELQTELENAFAIFINDTYWFLMPTKLDDPGVQATVVEELTGATGDTTVLHLSFDDGTGLTSGDQYWVSIADNGRITGWRYKLESGRESSYDWMDEVDCGMGIVLCTRKTNRVRDVSITFPKVTFSETMDRSLFLPPKQ